MAKKIGTSRPMVLDVLLPPFTESFKIVPSDAIHQWHYDQDGSYLPDRAVTPLMLVPTLSVADPETKKVYQPSLYRARWFALNTATGEYDVEITNTEDGDVDYILLADGTLKVKKNVPETAPVSLLCQVVYIDPRNAGKTYTVRDKVQLVTSRDTSVTTPRIDIDQEATVKYNPFIDGYTVTADGRKSKTFTFNATVWLGDSKIDPTGDSPYRVRWYAMGGGVTAETLIDATDAVTGAVTGQLQKFLCYVSGQNTPTLTVDAMMADGVTIVARVYNTETSTLYPTKAVRSLCWDTFKIDATTEAIDGGAVKQQTESKTFRNIVTIRNKTLSQQEVNENFVQEYKYRRASRTNTAGVTDTDTVETIGTGASITLEKDKLLANESSLVYAELALLGPYVVVVDDVTGKVVVDDTTKKVVIDRS